MNANPKLLWALGAWALAVSVPLAVGAERSRSKSTPATSKGAPPASVAPNQSFEAFQIVVERNIFNPSRIGRIRANADEKGVRTDEISLVGTVRSDREKIALFDSPDAQYRKAVREGESLGDFKVRQVGADGVELMREDKPLSLKVAQQLRRVEGADWTVTMNKAAQADPKAMAPGAANTINASRTGEASSAELPADASEVLKRLMKKREKQLK